MALLIGMGLLMVSCRDTHVPEQSLKWDDPSILRGLYAGEYGQFTGSTFQKVGTVNFQFTPHYLNDKQYNIEGFIQVNGGPQLALQDAQVNGWGSQRYLQPQHSPLPAASMLATAVDGNTTYRISLVVEDGFAYPGMLSVMQQGDLDPQATYRFQLARQTH